MPPTALRGRLPLLPLLDGSGCTDRVFLRPRSSLPRRSGRCLPATAPTRRMRTRPLDGVTQKPRNGVYKEGVKGSLSVARASGLRQQVVS